MNMALVIPVAASSGWGWGIGMAVCMLIMGVMMFAMVGRGRARGGRPRSWSGGWPRWREETPTDWPGWRAETPTNVLDRRFAEGEISAEEYRERRGILANAIATRNGGHKDEALTAPGPGGGRQR